MFEHISARSMGNDELDGREREDFQGQYFIFQVGPADFGIELWHVGDIMPLPKLSPMPRTLPYVAGVMKLRTNIIPVLDMRRLFGYPPTEYDDRSCMIVIGCEGHHFGIIVDEAKGLIHIEAELLQNPHQEESGREKAFIRKIARIDGSVKQIIDSRAVFNLY